MDNLWMTYEDMQDEIDGKPLRDPTKETLWRNRIAQDWFSLRQQLQTAEERAQGAEQRAAEAERHLQLFVDATSEFVTYRNRLALEFKLDELDEYLRQIANICLTAAAWLEAGDK